MIKKEIGAVPFLYINNRMNLVLITSRGSGQWIIPKGQPEKDKSDKEVAVMEAWEEAGVKGEINGEAMHLHLGSGKNKIAMRLYPMVVKEIADEWPEKQERERSVLYIEDAEKIIKEDMLPVIHWLKIPRKPLKFRDFFRHLLQGFFLRKYKDNTPPES